MDKRIRTSCTSSMLLRLVVGMISAVLAVTAPVKASAMAEQDAGALELAGEAAVSNPSVEVQEEASLQEQDAEHPGIELVQDAGSDQQVDVVGGEVEEELVDSGLQAEALADEGVSLVVQGSDSAVMPALTGSAYESRTGWKRGLAQDGSLVLGSAGDGLALEAYKLQMTQGELSCKAYAQKAGWTTWKSSGTTIGAAGKGRQLEAVRMKLSGQAARDWSLQYRAYVASRGWMGWTQDGAPAGTTGFGAALCAIEMRVVPKGTALVAGGGDAYQDAGLSASAHVQAVGWQSAKRGYDVTIGTMGSSLRMEALKINRPALDLSGNVVYRAHVQGIGWQESVKNGALAGTKGKSLRIEALKIGLTGQLSKSYDVWYRLHVQNLGWLAWASNWHAAGTQGFALRVEAVQIVLVPKGQKAPAADGQNVGVPFIKTFKASYQAMAGGAWSSRRTLGVTGSKGGPAVNAIRMRLPAGVESDIQYAAHLSGIGWTGFSDGDAPVGSGRTTVEAVRVRLVGAASRIADVWYRVYVRGVGWTKWACNGGDAGTTGRSLSISALQVRVLSRNADAPSSDSAALAYECLDSFGPQLKKDANGAQKRLRRSALRTPWPGAALCAGWVELVYEGAGFGMINGNANDLYDWYCKSTNVSDLKVGMIVAVSTHTHSYAGWKWGHVGMYIGDGWVMHSIGTGVFKMPLTDWMAHYGTTVPPKWGWLGNVGVA